MTHDCHSVAGDLNPADNLEAIEASGHSHHGYPVVAGSGSTDLTGIIMHHELEEFSEDGKEASLSEILTDQKLITIHPDTSIRDAANTLVIKDVLQAPVVSRKDPGKLLGIVTLHDITRQQNAIEETMERD